MSATVADLIITFLLFMWMVVASITLHDKDYYSAAASIFAVVLLLIVLVGRMS